MPSPWRSEYTSKDKIRITPEETRQYVAGTLSLTSLASTYGVHRHTMREAIRWMGITRTIT